MAMKPWGWNSGDLSSVLARLTSPGMQCWMQSDATVREMIALSSTLLYHGVLARSTSARKVSAIESLPTEIVDIILLYAAGTCLQTRFSLLGSCRLFRCLVILNSAFQTDLASLPLHAPAFFAHFARAFSRKRSFRLVLDQSNRNTRLPPHVCLLSGAVFAHTIIVQHTLNTGALLTTLVRQSRCASLTELVLGRIGDFVSVRRLLGSIRPGEDRVLSVRAPRLNTVKLRQVVLDFPETFDLRHLQLDCRTDHHIVYASNVYPLKTLHSLLSRNQSLESVALVDPIRVAPGEEGPNSSITLPMMKDFRIVSKTQLSMAWLLRRLVLPSRSYLSLKVGEDSSEPFDVSLMVDALMPHLRSRMIDTVTIIESHRRTSLLFSQGPRTWEGVAGSLLPPRFQGHYTPCPGAVDVEIDYTKPFLDPVPWTDVIRALKRAGFNLSLLKTYEFHGDVYLQPLNVLYDHSILHDVERLRFWPDSAHTVKSSLWQLCAPNPVTWSVVARNFITLFPKVHLVVDARNGDLWGGRTVEDLIARVRVLPYHY